MFGNLGNRTVRFTEFVRLNSEFRVIRLTYLYSDIILNKLISQPLRKFAVSREFYSSYEPVLK
jgi:hypothetical protein